MSEVELTQEQMKKVCEDSITYIVSIVERQKQIALSSVRETQTQLMERYQEQYQTERRKSCLAYLFKVVLNAVVGSALNIDRENMNADYNGPTLSV